MVSLLVGVQHGISQVVNQKQSVTNTLTEFSSITRVELIPESERVSLVKIYLQDITVAHTHRPTPPHHAHTHTHTHTHTHHAAPRTHTHTHLPHLESRGTDQCSGLRP